MSQLDLQKHIKGVKNMGNCSDLIQEIVRIVFELNMNDYKPDFKIEMDRYEITVYELDTILEDALIKTYKSSTLDGFKLEYIINELLK